MAATIRFNEPIRVAALLNVRGTIEVLALGKQCSKLKTLVYVSTAVSHATHCKKNKEVLEQFYPCPMPPAALVEMAERMEEERLNFITPSLINNWPNTYTFTKALAEEALRTMGGNLPICIVRPSIVLCSYREPIPGWMDMSNMFGPSGVLLGAGLGILRVIKADGTNRLSLVPVDLVNNAIIAAGWDSIQVAKEGDIPIYAVANINACLRWDFVHREISSMQYKMSSPKAIWYCYLTYTPNFLVFWLLSWFLHMIPAYIIDAVDYVLKIKPKNIPSLVGIYDKIHKFTLIYDEFMLNEWHFRDTNTMAMMSRMTDADKAIYNCDITSMDHKTMVALWCVGVRKYLIKDGLKNSLEASRKQKILKYVNGIVMAVYLLSLAYIVYSIVKLFVF